MNFAQVAAQCCHACLGAYKRALKMCPAAVKAWQISGQAKVAVKVSRDICIICMNTFLDDFESCKAACGEAR